MAFTSKDRDASEAAIASCELTIRAADGRLVIMRTMAELFQARAVITNGIGSGRTAHRPYPCHQVADFSD